MVARSELRLPVLTGRAWAFADDLAAADILPARFALLPAPEGARRLFADLDAALAAQLRAGDVLVAGQQLGAGPGGGEAARAPAAASGVPSGTPRRSSLRLPLSLPGSFASLTMITRTDS